MTLNLYTKAACPLCDEMKRALASSPLSARFVVEEIDIGGDEELEARYGTSVPVLTCGERALAKGRLDPEAFARRFERLVRAD